MSSLFFVYEKVSFFSILVQVEVFGSEKTRLTKETDTKQAPVLQKQFPSVSATRPTLTRHLFLQFPSEDLKKKKK